MNDQQIKQLMSSFGRTEQVSEWKPFGHGHINDTFLIRTIGDEAPDFVLQRKNHQIFKDVPGMVNNILLATGHIRKQLEKAGEPEIDRKVMTYLQASDGKYYVQDSSGNFWTLFLFIRDSFGIEAVTNPEQAYSAGQAFGKFQLQLADLDGKQMIETVPNFHNGKFRFWQFEQALANDAAGRKGEMKAEIEKLMVRSAEMTQLQQWLDEGKLPVRITHNDTKINNILYDADGNILCVIDLDTVMPGSILFDFGDAIRTLGDTAVEDEPDTSKIGFNAGYYEAYARGYLSESKMFLTDLEKKNLAYSCRYMVWEQAMRFLTDYLNGDTYYKIDYPEHNKVRSLSQIRYLEVLEENSAAMEKCVADCL